MCKVHKATPTSTMSTTRTWKTESVLCQLDLVRSSIAMAHVVNESLHMTFFLGKKTQNSNERCQKMPGCQMKISIRSSEPEASKAGRQYCGNFELLRLESLAMDFPSAIRGGKAGSYVSKFLKWQICSMNFPRFASTFETKNPTASET